MTATTVPPQGNRMSSDEAWDLVLRYENKIRRVARTFVRKASLYRDLPAHLDLDDLTQQARLAFYSVAIGLDPQWVGAFARHAERRANRDMGAIVNRGPWQAPLSIDAAMEAMEADEVASREDLAVIAAIHPDDEDEASNVAARAVAKVLVADLLARIYSLPDERQRRILLAWVNGESFAAIARAEPDLGSASRVRQLHKAGIAAIKAALDGQAAQ